MGFFGDMLGMAIISFLFLLLFFFLSPDGSSTSVGVVLFVCSERVSIFVFAFFFFWEE